MSVRYRAEGQVLWSDDRTSVIVLWTTPTETFTPVAVAVEDGGAFAVVDDGAAAADLALVVGGFQRGRGR